MLSVNDAASSLHEWKSANSNSSQQTLPPFDVALCTVEKANQLVNSLSCLGLLSDIIGTVVVDEIHLVADPQKGDLIMVMLSKIMFENVQMENSPDSFHSDSQRIQIIGMSATLPNLKLIAQWLNAVEFSTTFRPIDLKEMVFCGDRLMLFEPNNDGSNHWVNIPPPKIKIKQTYDTFIPIVLDSLMRNMNTLVFCSTKKGTEITAKAIAIACQEYHRVDDGHIGEIVI